MPSKEIPKTGSVRVYISEKQREYLSTLLNWYINKDLIPRIDELEAYKDLTRLEKRELVSDKEELDTLAPLLSKLKGEN